MAMQYKNWILQARQHWRDHQPNRYKTLKESGKLEAALSEAAEATAEAMQALVDEGFDREQAWEMVREQHLFPPEEPSQDETASKEAYSTAREINRMMADLGNE